ncbi:hypothetical protein HDU98_005320 [Podochytrium sp. JEL0797]|nr:hypothetical protein HDU98_005320 [Podochytrium sp. JEL0797]
MAVVDDAVVEVEVEVVDGGDEIDGDEETDEVPLANFVSGDAVVVKVAADESDAFVSVVALLVCADTIFVLALVVDSVIETDAIETAVVAGPPGSTTLEEAPAGLLSFDNDTADDAAAPATGGAGGRCAFGTLGGGGAPVILGAVGGASGVADPPSTIEGRLEADAATTGGEAMDVAIVAVVADAVALVDDDTGAEDEGAAEEAGVRWSV